MTETNMAAPHEPHEQQVTEVNDLLTDCSAKSTSHDADVQSGTQASSICPLTETQAGIERALDELLLHLPEDPDAATAHAATVLEMRPQPELIAALQLLTRPGSAQPLRAELLRKLVLLRLLVDKHLRELNRSSFIEPRTLGAASRAITTLIELVSALRQEFGTKILELQHRDAQQFNGLMRSLMPATDRLNSYGLLISMLEPLAQETLAGRAGNIVYLQRHEADLFTAALNPENETGPAGRIILDTVALRCGLQEALEEWQDLSKQAPGESGTDLTAESIQLEIVKLESRRQEMLARLRVGMSIYNVLLERIQYQQSATLSQGDKESFDRISAAQRLLFAVYSQIVGVVRDPVPMPEESEGDVDSALDGLFAEVEAGEENSPEMQSEEEVYLEALTKMRDADQGQAEVTMTAATGPRRGRRRRIILLACAAVLAVVAAGVNIALWQTPSPVPDPPLEEFSAAMPLDQAINLGPAMYAEIPAFNWNAMDLEERMRRVDLMGELAAARGFQSVILVDESRTDLARWSREDGAVLTPAGSTIPD